MASPADDVARSTFLARDGTRLVWREMGEGRPLLLLHGLFSSAFVNWIKFGTASRLVASGMRVIMPDLRAHGDSEAPHEPSAYPQDILIDDLKDLIAHLALDEFELGGFSLGARSCVRAVLSGVRPNRLMLCGMGLEGLAGWEQRSAFFLEALDRYETAKRGDPAWMSIQFMKTMKVDRIAARLLLHSFADTEAEALTRITMPTLVVCGDQDQDNGSAHNLVVALPDARLIEIPGTHMASVTQPALGEALATFLTA